MSDKFQSHILSFSLSGSNWCWDWLSLFNLSLPVFHHPSHRLLVAGMMLSHRLLVAGMMLAPQSKCSVPGSFENETLLICIIYIQEKVHQSIPKADTGLPWCTWCWNSSLVYSFNKSSWWGGGEWQALCMVLVARCYRANLWHETNHQSTKVIFSCGIYQAW